MDKDSGALLCGPGLLLISFVLSINSTFGIWKMISKVPSSSDRVFRYLGGELSDVRSSQGFAK